VCSKSDLAAQSQDRNNNPLIYEGILRKTFDRIGENQRSRTIIAMLHNRNG